MAKASAARPSSPGSLYRQIRESLRGDILRGVYRPHERMPSESELIARFGVSRITVRQALGELEKEGVIFRIAGKGSYVAQPKPFQELGRLQGFAESMAMRGHRTWNRLVSLEHGVADAQVAQRLALSPAAPVTEIRRVRHLDGRPVSLDVTFVPRHVGERLEREDLATRDIFLILENDYALPLGHADLAIDAVLADSEIAAQLGLPAGAPLLRIERLTCTRDGRPLDYEWLYCRADNFQYRLRVHRDPGVQPPENAS
ncbi:MAG: GntR family transcriptional regulator [Solimonas sp.]